MFLRKMFRDMKLQKAQFISVFFMAFLGVFVYAGINAEWHGMQSSSDRYYRETNLADVWIMGSEITSGDVSAAQKIDGVSDAQLRLVVDGLADLPGTPTLRINVVDANTVSTPYSRSGIDFDPSQKGVWLDEDFAKGNGLVIGDRISVTVNGQYITQEIKGLIMHPEYVHNTKDESQMMQDPKLFGFAYISSVSLSDWDTIPYNQLLLTLEKGTDLTNIRSQAEDVLSDRFVLMITRDTYSGLAMFEAEIVQNRAIGAFFPVVFFMIAALTMLTTMTRMVSGQRTQIGVFKAMGFSRRKILMHYISFGLWLGLIGGILGLLLGPMVFPSLLYTMQMELYTMPYWFSTTSVTDVFALVIAVLCCGFSCYWACRKELKEVPAESLRPKVPKAGRHTRLEKSRIWQKTGFSFQWNIRDVLRSRIRSTMAIVGVAGCSMLLLWAMGLNDSMRYVTQLYYHDINTYAYKIIFEETATEEDRAAVLADYDGQFIQESGIELSFEGTEKSGSLTVTDEGDELHFMDRNYHRIDLPGNGISLTSKMADLLGAKVGDQIQWRIFGEKTWVTSEIVALYRTPMSQGIACIRPVYESLGRTMTPTSFLTSSDAAGARELSGVKDIQSIQQQIDTFNTILNSMYMIIAVLILAACVLGSVVLYNLGALSFSERTRELATLKVLGFSKKRINALLRAQNTWLTAIGICFGLPIGYGMLVLMMSTMAESSDFSGYIAPASILICVASTFLVSTLVNWILSTKVKSIDMVSSLKSVE